MLVGIFEACADTKALNMNLGWIHERTELWYKNEKDSLGGLAYTRLLKMHFNSVNNDSIFIPIGYIYNHILTARIDSHPSLETTFCGEQSLLKSGNKVSECSSFASGDTIWISLILRVGSPKSNSDKDNRWLHEISTKTLLSKLKINICKDSLPCEKSNLPIPDIIFNIDTNNVNINPVVKSRNKEVKR